MLTECYPVCLPCAQCRAAANLEPERQRLQTAEGGAWIFDSVKDRFEFKEERRSVKRGGRRRRAAAAERAQSLPALGEHGPPPQLTAEQQAYERLADLQFQQYTTSFL